MKSKKSLITIIASMLVLVLVFTGCASSAPKQTPDAKEPSQEAKKEEPKAPEYPTKAMEFIAPAGAGGGWDLTIRTVEKTLTDAKLVTVPMPITNRTGGGGAVNLAYMQEKKGSDKIISVYSPPILLLNLSGSTEYSYKDTTPIAKLITDYAAFVVAKDSKYKTIADVMDALKKDPKSVKVAGTSAVGSMDHVQFLLIAKAAGVTNLKDIDYISFQDNSGAAQLMGGHVDLLSVGLSDVRALLESKELVGLASTAPKRVGEGIVAEVPTVKEQGIDAVFENWRGLFGAPGMPDYAQKYWADVLGKMVETPEWKEACKRNGWAEAYADTAEFNTFLEKTNEDYKTIMEEIGMLKK
ncbi:MAG: tripartite tricarboxylate transporter substrate binding protein [Clostridia bacterium]